MRLDCSEEFKQCLSIERTGAELFEGISGRLKYQGWQVIEISTVVGVQGITDQIQLLGCDYLLQTPKGVSVAVEMKCEKSNKYGNLFIELFSNTSPSRLGWGVTAGCDLLGYTFADDGITYFMNWPLVKNWGFKSQNFFNYPLKAQSKYQQKNIAYGFCVPIADLQYALPESFIEMRYAPLAHNIDDIFLGLINQ
jgi:hypothetical protein